MPAVSVSFQEILSAKGWKRFTPAALEIFQVNLGKLCNMTCLHCHVDAGPDKIRENMGPVVFEACLKALDKTQAHTLDITGGAPELNPYFRRLVEEGVKRGKHVMDRCNLTVLLLERHKDLPEWFAQRGVEIVSSLPHYRRMNTDAQRGVGVYEKSIEAMKRLNAVGYGKGDPRLKLTLVSNPVGAYLAGNQAEMEREWKAGLAENHGVFFDRLITINNMPISRFLSWLEHTNNLERYMELLTNAFNPATIEGVMCRNTVSIGWDGKVYDCDFNQMLDISARYPDNKAVDIFNFDEKLFAQREIITDRHCFGCTAGAGSSCTGAIEK